MYKYFIKNTNWPTSVIQEVFEYNWCGYWTTLMNKTVLEFYLHQNEVQIHCALIQDTLSLIELPSVSVQKGVIQIFENDQKNFLNSRMCHAGCITTEIIFDEYISTSRRSYSSQRLLHRSIISWANRFRLNRITELNVSCKRTIITSDLLIGLEQKSNWSHGFKWRCTGDGAKSILVPSWGFWVQN